MLTREELKRQAEANMIGYSPAQGGSQSYQNYMSTQQDMRNVPSPYYGAPQVGVGEEDVTDVAQAGAAGGPYAAAAAVGGKIIGKGLEAWGSYRAQKKQERDEKRQRAEEKRRLAIQKRRQKKADDANETNKLMAYSQYQTNSDLKKSSDWLRRQY